MISFALMLMTLPSRMAEVRAGRADRGGLPDSSREGSGGGSVRGGERLDKVVLRLGTTPVLARTGRYNKER